MIDTTDHAAAIRELLTGVDWNRMSGARRMHEAIEHADALAAKLEAERARVRDRDNYIARIEARLRSVREAIDSFVDSAVPEWREHVDPDGQKEGS